MGLLTQNDATLWRGFFVEMAKLRGIPVEYRYVISQEVSIHSEFFYELSEPIPIDIIFDSNPSISTLRKVGWMSENSDDKPYIAQIPFDLPNLKIGCTISIKDFDLNSTRDFKITSIKMLLEFPDCWTVTLAPIFFNKEPKTAYVETNYNYLDTPDADVDNDAPDNKYGHEWTRNDNDLGKCADSNFQFLNVNKNKK